MLKSLELFGFKSFAERTHFDFSAGITGIIGPNGSGKSNVVDGIKWILGDQSAKSLRGKEMTDVIFNGAVGRKPSGFAEATLTFDNSEGMFPLETEEVHVGRRLYRSGDSEYLINRAPARLKDIRNLFLGTGAGSAAYCIIEQGQVDQILQANASSRRAIFEEAAGISRYKTRRTEALRKLERVEQNLLRLTDIVDEVEAQRNSTRSQAAKAAKFREISNELKERWLGLAADRFRHLNSQIQEIEETTGNFTKQIEAKNGQHQQLEERMSVLDQEISEVENRLREAERRASANREAVATHQSTVEHQSSRLHELNSEIIRLRDQRARMQARVRETSAEVKHNKGVLEESEHDVSRARESMKSHDARIKEFTEKAESGKSRIEKEREDQQKLIRDVSETGNGINALQSQLESSRSAEQNAKLRLEELGEKLTDCKSERDGKQRQLEQTGGEIADLEWKIQEIQQRKQKLVGEQGRFRQSLAELRELRSACLARKNVLEDLESRQEGLGIGVREILRRAETSDTKPWNQVLGSAADLLDVDLEDAALLDVALGSRSQLIVMRQFDSLIDYLNGGSSQISGRVSFVKLDEKEYSRTLSAQGDLLEEQNLNVDAECSGPNRDPLPDLTDRPGVLKRADALVRPSESFPQLAFQLLADTWVVERLDVAMALTQEDGTGCRFVTLQGELLESDGTLVVGTIHSETAIVSRKSELRQLKNDLQKLGRSIEEEQRRLETVGESLSDVDTAVKSVDTQMQELIDRQTALKSEATNCEKEYQRLLKEQQSLNADLRNIKEEQTRLDDELQQSQMESARLEEARQGQQDRIDRMERDIARSEHRLQTMKHKRTAEQLDLAKQEERLHSLRNSFERLQRDQQQRVQQYEEVERHFADALIKRRQTSLHILNAGAVLAELSLAGERFSRETKSLFSDKERLREQRSELQKEENRIRQRRRELHEALHQEEIKQRDLRHQIRTLEERIEEEYHVSLPDIVKSGASEMQRYLQQRHHPASGRESDDLEDRDSEIHGIESGAEEFDGETEIISEIDDESIQPVEQLPAKDFPEIRFDEICDDLEAGVNRLRKKLKLMGSVNTDSLRDLDELENRYSRLSAQLQDLVEAKNVLEEILEKINRESQRLFTEAFESIRANFQILFRKAFSGGNGDILLEDPQDVLECGIDIVARPPGKELKSISLMSGGEKSLTAFALLLAIFKCRPSPYCVLDEVDAALDEANVERFLSILGDFKQTTQFVLITHKKSSMTIADVLYGITMEQSGVSKRMSVRFEDVREDGKFAQRSTDASTLSAKEDDHKKDAA